MRVNVHFIDAGSGAKRPGGGIQPMRHLRKAGLRVPP
jgi:hypothetical protein